MALLERETEGATLRALAAHAATGEGSCVVVAGGAGIGKTSLLGAGPGDLRAAGGELEDDVPFGVVRELLGPLASADALAAAPAGLGAPVFVATSEIPDAGAVLHGLHALVVAACGDRPLTLVVDDVQWADAASVRFLAYLSRRVASLPCLLVLGLRTGGDEGARPDVTSLVHQPGTRRIDLAPLTVPAVAALVGATLGGEVEDGFGIACHTATGGNPLLCVAMADELARREVRGTVDDCAAALWTGAVGVAGTVRHRIARCGPAATALARAVAILGPAATYARARGLAELPEADRAVEALVAEGVLEDHRPLAFTHPIVRAAVLEDLAPGAQARWHARAARLVADEGLPEQAAHHLRFAEPLADPAAVAVLRSAAATALGRGAAEVAVTYLTRALQEPPPAPDRARVLLDLAVAEMHTGGRGAVAHLEEARALSPEPALRLEIAATLADAQIWTGRWQDAVATLEDGIDAAGAEPGVVALHGRLLLAAIGSASARKLTVGRLAALRARETFAPQDPTAAFLAVELAMASGPAQRVVTLVEGALPAAVPPGGSVEFHAELLAMALVLADERDTALRVFDAALSQAREEGRESAAARVRALRAWAGLRFGRPAEAQADARAAVDVDDAPLVIAASYSLAVGTLIGATLEVEGPAAARRVADAFAGVAADPDVIGEQSLPLARAALALAEMQPQAALDALETPRRWEEAWGGTSVTGVPWRPLAVRAHLLLGDRDAAAARAAEQCALAEEFGAASVRGSALHAAALVDRDVARLEEAIVLLRAAPARTALVQALIDLGAMLRGAHQPARARVPLREALDLADRAGAAALADRARDELRAAGGRLGRAHVSGFDALTPAEVRACRLAAEGLTNGQIAETSFLSVRTVEMHLSNAYRKLGIAGRADLAATAGTWADDPA